MAATTSWSPSTSISSNQTNFTPTSKSLKPLYLVLPKSQKLKSLNNKDPIFRCEIRCLGPHHSWTIEHVPDLKDSIHNNNNNSSPSLSSNVSVSAANASSQYSTRNSKKVSLFYCDETKTLAQKIAAEYDGIELRNIKWGLTFFSYFYSFMNYDILFVYWFFSGI